MVRGFAALLAESLWLSVELLLFEALPRRRSRRVSKGAPGKAKPFRKDSGKAAEKNFLKNKKLLVCGTELLPHVVVHPFVDIEKRRKLSCYPVNLTGSHPNHNSRPGTVAIIPARFESTRLPGKALLDIAGKPMICWVAERALASRNIDRVIVATDSQKIFDVVVAAGIEAALTREDHQSGTDRIAEVAANIDGADIVVNVQGDEPLISPETIERAVEQMLLEIKSSSPVGIVTTWEPIDSLSDLLNLAVVKIAVGDNDLALYFSRSPMPFPRDATVKYGDPNRALESEPALFRHFRKHTGLYVYRRDVLLQFPKWPQTRLEKFESLEQLRALENGVRIRVIKASKRSLGVDTPDDLEQVRVLMSEGKFELLN